MFGTKLTREVRVVAALFVFPLRSRGHGGKELLRRGLK